MNDSPYNKLPNDIKRKYKIVYSELLCDNVTMFKNKDEKWGVISSKKKFGLFNFYDFLIKPIYNSVGFNKDLKLIEAVKYENNVWNQDKNTFLYFDLNGKIIWQSKKGERVRIDNFGNIFINRANKIGLLDKESFNQRIEPKYQQLDALNNTLFKAFQNSKYGIINR
ncbi:hypothetical protein [Polluticaenibacter yanchengensis]|uniref:WG repeat-containing protein n=1 Tax=Polluticaenibacter yanchengensis TaxID=3014562 RepID=A0ABT4UHN2_9BACT|nr:hypothetical protein [Chitinophagaceae bacterium LY-5]